MLRAIPTISRFVPLAMISRYCSFTAIVASSIFAIATTTQAVTPSPQDKPAAESATAGPSVSQIDYQQTVQKAVDYLLDKGQADDGSFSKQLSPAVTALCTSALLAHNIPANDARIQKSLKFLEGLVKPDGGIYATGSTLRNYETSISIMCFSRANTDGKYDETIQKAIAFLKGIQWDEGENYTLESSFYGGQGYGSHKRPDASNTSYFVDALKAAGEDPKSQAFQKAVVFMSRCQNVSSELNTATWATEVTAENRGGFIYSCVGDGETKAEPMPAGQGLRSYASMTYAGLKSLIYAGVKKDDFRVKAAMEWISRNYDLDSNPGLGKQGLFYYYHVFAKALSAAEIDQLSDADGKAHDWRLDLIGQLAKLQREDGSWTNVADRWYEGDPNLVTGYALLSLSYAKKEAWK